MLQCLKNIYKGKVILSSKYSPHIPPVRNSNNAKTDHKNTTLFAIVCSLEAARTRTQISTKGQ